MCIGPCLIEDSDVTFILREKLSQKSCAKRDLRCLQRCCMILKFSGCQAVVQKTVPSIPKDLTVFNFRAKQSDVCLQGPQMQ